MHMYTSIGCCIGELHAPIIMYGLRLYIVVSQELCLHVAILIVSMTSPSFVRLHLPVSEITGSDLWRVTMPKTLRVVGSQHSNVDNSGRQSYL